jgi:hypothetical protein
LNLFECCTHKIQLPDDPVNYFTTHNYPDNTITGTHPSAFFASPEEKQKMFPRTANASAGYKPFFATADDAVAAK